MPTYSPDFIWDNRTGRYRYVDSGRYVSREAMLSLTRRSIEASRREVTALGQALINKQITLEDWQRQTATRLRSLHMRNALLARGGADRMRPQDYLQVGRTLKEEYRYLRNFAQDINNGSLSQAQFIARLAMYSDRGRVSFDKSEQDVFQEQGYLYMQRFLGNANHCPECPEYASRGIQPIGTLPLPTEACRCRAHCKCTVRYYKNYSEAV